MLRHWEGECFVARAIHLPGIAEIHNVRSVPGADVDKTALNQLVIMTRTPLIGEEKTNLHILRYGKLLF